MAARLCDGRVEFPDIRRIQGNSPNNDSRGGAAACNPRFALRNPVKLPTRPNRGFLLRIREHREIPILDGRCFGPPALP